MSSAPNWTEAAHEPLEVEERERWLGRYRLCFEIASGGMATVYLARARGAAGFEKPVAVKRVHTHLARDASFVDMFMDEARLAARIDHPNVCTVFDFGEADGAYFMAMEYLVGEPLARALSAMSRAEPMDAMQRVAWVARVVAEAAEGLHAAHELEDEHGRPLGVVHRDVSPQNLFVTYDGNVKVVDFGIAYAHDRLQHTRTGQLKGKVAYMAPEQIEGRRVDRRADVWALGVVAWEALTMRRLFSRGGDLATMRAIAGEPVPAPSTVVADLPPALDAIVLGALEKDPERRTPTARALSEALNEMLAAHGVSATAAHVAEEMGRLFPAGAREKRKLVDRAVRLTGRRSSPGEALGERMEPRRGRSRRVLFTYAAITVAVVAFSVALGLGTERGRNARATPETSEPSTETVTSTAEASGSESREPSEDEQDERLAADAASHQEPAPSVAPRAEGPPDEPSSTPTMRRRATHAPGRVAISTPGGWATVYLDGRRVGETPGVIALPPGRHVLSVRPNDQAPYRRVPVRVTPGRTSRVRVDLR